MDQNNQKQKVLVAMTGRLDSTVAAYLLKKQGHQVFGICVLFLETEEEKQLFPEWDIPQVQHVKEICDAFDITFYGVQGHDYFHAKIDEYLISSKLSGQAFNGEILKNQALIEVLMEKADKLGVDFVATGHFAKLTRNQSTDQFYLLMASDHEEDQSFCLSRLTQKQMRRLSFPLSEVRKEQVEKIKHLFNFELLPPVVKREIPVEKLARYIEKRSPEKLRKTGMVMNFKEDLTLGENEGIHYYAPGMSKVFLKDMHTIDPNYRVVNVDPAKGNVFVEFDKNIVTDHLVLISLVIDEKMDTSRPTEYYFKIGKIAGKHAGLFMMKNNGKALIELTIPLKEVAPFGDYVVMYDRKGAGGRVLASGQIEKAGLMTEFGLETIPFSLRRHLEDEDESENEEEEVAKTAKKKSSLSDIHF